jgi:hypothetical protein
MEKLIYYDKENDWRCNADGTRSTAKIKIAYNENPTLAYNIFSTGTTPDPLTGTITAEWAIANDFKNDGVMCRTLNADIDLSAIASGIVKVPINTFTSDFLAVVTGRQFTTAYMRLKLLDADAKTIFTALLEIQAVMDIDPGGGTPPGTIGNYYTKAETTSLISAKAAKAGSDDIEITASAKGVILKGRTNNTRCRFYIDDTDTDNPIISIEKVV